MAQSIGYHISLPRVVVDSKIIILDKLEPSSLPKIQVPLYEDILQTLMIHVYLTPLSHEIVPPNLEGMTTADNSKSWVGQFNSWFLSHREA
jgi:hypothetical protein